MKYSSILITGGAGFIGGAIAIFLKDKYPRARIIALDNLKRRGSEMNVGRLHEHEVEFVHGDIRVPEDIRMSAGIDLVIECSAEPSVLAGYGDNPCYVINTNLAGAINCFELARAHNAGVIFLSTSRVYPYGAVNGIGALEKETRYEWAAQQAIRGWSLRGISEDFSLDGPRTLYGATKLAAEHILQEYMAMYGIKGVINRCGVIAGPWQFGKIDQGVFTLWMLAHYFKRPLKYIGFGGGGKQVRDLLHVNDLCALLDIQIASLEKISGSVYNIGGGSRVSLSLRETTRLCEQITGNRISVGKELRNRPGDVRIHISDTSRISRELGWTPQKTAPAILGDAFRWIRGHERQAHSLINARAAVR